MTSENDPCFCELAALDALDLLDESERQTLEEYQAELPELKAELEAFQEAVSAIPYGVPSVPIAADLKRRLFQRINSELPSTQPSISNPQPAIPAPRIPVSTTIKSGFWQFAATMLRQLTRKKHVAVRANDLAWLPYQIEGVTVAPLHIDIAKREVVALLKADAGAYYPKHRHATVEEIYMLEGDLTIDGESFGPGDYIRSRPGSTHTPTTNGGCKFLVRTSLDDEYLEE